MGVGPAFGMVVVMRVGRRMVVLLLHRSVIVVVLGLSALVFGMNVVVVVIRLGRRRLDASRGRGCPGVDMGVERPAGAHRQQRHALGPDQNQGRSIGCKRGERLREPGRKRRRRPKPPDPPPPAPPPRRAGARSHAARRRAEITSSRRADARHHPRGDRMHRRDVDDDLRCGARHRGGGRRPGRPLAGLRAWGGSPREALWAGCDATSIGWRQAL